ncbi:MAG: SMP-30/gluconolactonase/LRE family protein [Gemmatimonadaceae bacterium]|nr:SMP-30/gluconolactonase/LRE family protein [Gemmatimonadaceae bacterium]NUQ93439.1 SMP-30/gluconolactonase/LRE family protein [Gemmatimonadaceae bacterium]NUR19817.1 SMP-30/gluconolactonase/LRE family protein [Gemmatimonadaceae bacterium]
MRRLLQRSLSAALVVAAACGSTPRPQEVKPAATVERLDPALDALVPRDARVERLAGGFAWAEGPAWRKNGGYLLLSDAPHNTMWRWKEGEGLSVFLRPAGYTGTNPPGRELGSNGITIDASGAVVYADHGNRLIARLVDSNYTKVTLADRYQGKRFNSPNDLVFRANGDLYFTDPPYGLAGQDSDPAKELPFNGVYRVTPSGEVTLLTRELSRPNGIALSPDERTLYVANSDAAHAVWMAYDVNADGTIANGRVLFDATALVKQGKPGLPDGMKVDRDGNLFAGGPGGVLVITPQGKHLGTIVTGQPTANCAWGDDGSTLYMTAKDQLFRIRLTTRGARF